tara:strand:+ start:468 stop:1661 length:1194 start_codon:yes stop_codon:yes gene_type:complete
MSYKYSILIPTYNRRHLLEKTILSVTNQSYENFELIISDSGSEDNTWDFISNLNHPKIKVFKPKKTLTEVENFEFILEKASGEWISIIGDDDGLAPNFFESVDEVINKFPDVSAISAKAGYYYHENVEDLYGNRVVAYNYISNKIKKKNSKLNLFLCILGLKNKNDVPALYTTGIIKRSLIENIKKKSDNKFFHSIIEDYYSIVAILFETNFFVRIEKPIFWIGSSSSSSGKGLVIYENNKTVDKYLHISKMVSEKLHKVGISSIYFLEAIYKHPYISNFWKSDLIHKIALVFAFIDIKKRKDTNRIKIKMSIAEILGLILSEIKKLEISKINFYSNIYLLKTFFVFKSVFEYLIKINYFLRKKINKKCIVINSTDRKKYSDIPTCNIIISKIIKNN